MVTIIFESHGTTFDNEAGIASETRDAALSPLGERQAEQLGKRIMIIGSRATQYGLEHWIKGVPLKEVVTAPWRWQPGWEYQLKKINQDMDK